MNTAYCIGILEAARAPVTQAQFNFTTNGAGFTLQSTTNLVSAAGWSNVFPSAVIVGGQNTVTNPASGAQKFYRLSQ